MRSGVADTVRTLGDQQTNSDQFSLLMINDIQKILPLGPGVRVVKYDLKTTLIALEKPVAVKSHPNDGRVDKKALLVAPYKLSQKCYTLKSLFCSSTKELNVTYVYLLNRLDAPTSGLVLLSLDIEIAKTVRALFRAEKVKKKYHAKVKGKPRNATWVDRLLITNKNGQLRSKVSKMGNVAKTSIKLIKYDKETNISEVELTPYTGRTHQLRVQCAYHGHPILGDKTYGDFAFNKEHKPISMFLNSSEIQLAIGRKVKFMATCCV